MLRVRRTGMPPLMIGLIDVPTNPDCAAYTFARKEGNTSFSYFSSVSSSSPHIR